MTVPAGLLDQPFAHRGLWDTAAPENTLAAFEAACAAGYGIELDVQLSADGEAVVFHDDTLDRLTGQSGAVEERTAEELGRIRVGASDQTIPTLVQALDIIGGRAFVLVELKTPDCQEGLLEQRVVDILADYAGPYALIGFSIPAHRWLTAHHPDAPRGFSVRNLTALGHAADMGASFLVLDQRLLPTGAARASRAAGLPLVAWTIQDEAALAHARAFADDFIFDGIRP